MHIPVLLKEVIQYLDLQPNENVIDATGGAGGHSLAILEKVTPRGKVLALEIDPVIYKITQQKLGNEKRLILVNDSYANMEKIAQEKNFQPVDGILFDLGMCSWQIEESKRGFSYLRDEALDMRFNPKADLTAAEIINFWPVDELEAILKIYGEEKYAKRISLAVKEARRKKRIAGTGELVEILQQTLPKNYDQHRLHPAARTFQALRIAVNNELEILQNSLEIAAKILSPQGRIAVIAFHSLEDRIVKKFFQNHPNLKILTKKPKIALSEEIKINPRSHSAKLRAAIKI